jgi:uncharacterized protein (TIGR02246 family)
MKRNTTCAAALLLAALPLLLPVARADDRADVDAATGRWIDAFNRKSTQDIVALYAPDAVLFGTSSPVLRDAPASVRDYFKDLPALGDATISLGEHRVQVFGDTAISTGFYTRASVQNGQTVRNPARFTFVYAKRAGKWVIVTHHSSALPEPPR